MFTWLKYLWKHYIKMEHEPTLSFSKIEAKCECGKHVYKTKSGKWVEV